MSIRFLLMLFYSFISDAFTIPKSNIIFKYERSFEDFLHGASTWKALYTKKKKEKTLSV